MGLYETFLVQPIFNLLVWLYNVIPGADFGFAVIALTLVVKFALWPLTHASLKSQKRMQELQPKLAELKEKHADDKEALAKAMMTLYQAEKVNPLSSCLPILIQLPILLALFNVLREGTVTDFHLLYPFVSEPETIQHVFLGIVDLTARSIPLALLAGGFQFIQTKMLTARRPAPSIRKKEGAKDEDMMAAMNKSMLYFMPVMTVVIGASFPAGLTLYWASTNVFSIFQQFVAFRDVKPVPEPATEAKVLEGTTVEKTEAATPTTFPKKK